MSREFKQQTLKNSEGIKLFKDLSRVIANPFFGIPQFKRGFLVAEIIRVFTGRQFDGILRDLGYIDDPDNEEVYN